MSAAAMPSDEKHDVVVSDDWTGGPGPDWRRKSKFDLWADDHPILFLAICVAVISLIKTFDIHTDSYLKSAVFFAIMFSALSAVYASVIGGVQLFARLAGKIKDENVRVISSSQKGYLFILLLIGFLISQLIGPFLIVMAMQFLAVWL